MKHPFFLLLENSQSFITVANGNFSKNYSTSWLSELFGLVTLFIYRPLSLLSENTQSSIKNPES